MSCTCHSLAAASQFLRRPQTFTTVRRIHKIAPWRATPLPYPNVPGPTPEPPRHQNGADERVARNKQRLKAQQAAKTAKPLPSNPKNAALLHTRFWRHVSVADTADGLGLQIMLDSTRPVRTASKENLSLPHHKRALASAIALEWDLLVSAQQALQNHFVPLTSLTSRAIELQTADAQRDPDPRHHVIATLMRYLTTDTLLCWAPERADQNPDQPSLRQTQIATAEPIIAFLNTHLFPGLDFTPSLDEESILAKPQSRLTERVIRGWIEALPPFELAALERGALATKSLLVAIRLLVEWSSHFGLHSTGQVPVPRFGIAEAAHACSIEVTWQTNIWGEVEDTHDVAKEDLARQLGSVIILVS